MHVDIYGSDVSTPKKDRKEVTNSTEHRGAADKGQKEREFEGEVLVFNES